MPSSNRRGCLIVGSLTLAIVVDTWLRSGGSLLLVADHAPYGLAAKRHSERFGVA